MHKSKVLTHQPLQKLLDVNVLMLRLDKNNRLYELQHSNQFMLTASKHFQANPIMFRTKIYLYTCRRVTAYSENMYLRYRLFYNHLFLLLQEDCYYFVYIIICAYIIHVK